MTAVATFDMQRRPPFRHRREAAVGVAYAVLLATLAAARPAFFHGQFRDTAVAAGPTLVMAVGMTLVLLARQIDISIGSQFSICGVVLGLLAKAGLPMPAAVAVAVLTGAAFGAVNGVLVAYAGLPSIVVTLATLVILRGGLRWAREGESVHGLPASFQWFGLGQQVGQWAVLATAVAVLVAFAMLMRYVAAGRAVYAVGSDPEAARLAGLDPPAVTLAVFILMGGLAGLAAVLNAVRFAQVDAAAGDGRELGVIAAVVVGGTAVAGGRGTLVGTLLGVALLATVGPALVFLGVRAQWQLAVQGAIILLAVAADAMPVRGAGHG